MEHLVSAGFDPVYGARPLKRAIQQELENPLAQRILAGDFQPGDVIQVELEEGAPALKTGTSSQK
jgi:ATP-dependent Clp protease ATP-binding subunit ClpB